MAKSVKKTLGLKVVTGLTALGGILGVLAGLLVLVAGSAILSAIGGGVGGVLGGFVGVLGIGVLVSGIIGCVLAWYLWQGSNIARWIIGIFAALSILSILSGNILGAIIGAVEVYFLFFEKETKAIFE